MQNTKYIALLILGIAILPFMPGTGGKTIVVKYDQNLSNLHIRPVVISYSDENLKVGITLEGELLGNSFSICQSVPAFVDYSIEEYDKRVVIDATMSFQTHEVIGSLGSCQEKDQLIVLTLKPTTKYLSIWDAIVAR